ncbi:LacI family transcriptional regulator, partial [Klebsiella pneumoniae]|nr:LacI family transcriptional regulator [Klebsiella pneumoniae]
MNTIEDNLNQRISSRISIERESRCWSLNDLAERAGATRA